MMASIMGLPMAAVPQAGRRQSRDKKKAPWTAEEDAELRRWVRATYGDAVEASVVEWSSAASVFPNRSTKQIRERWCNVLDPSIKRDEWAEHELRILFEAQQELGNKWSEIAKRLPGRPEAAVKNTFYSSQRRARRRLQRFGESRTPNLNEIAVEAIEACKTAQALKQRREQARMRAGSSDDGEEDDDSQSMDSSSRKGRKGAKAKRKPAGGRKRARDAPHTLQPDAQMLGGLNLTDLGNAGLEGFSVDGVSAGMRLGSLPNMSIFAGGALGGMNGLGGMMMLPGLGSAGFGTLPSTSAGLGMPGALPLHSADGSILGTHNMMGSLGMLHSAPTSAPLVTNVASMGALSEYSKPAAIDLPAHVTSLLQPLGDGAVLASSPACMHPEETVVVLARYHAASNTTIPLQWSSGNSSSVAAAASAAAAAASASAPGSTASPAGMRGLDSTLGALSGLGTVQDVNSLLKAPATASGVSPGAAAAPRDATSDLITAAASGDKHAVVEAAKVVAAASTSGLGEDDKTRVATVLASLGNGDYDGSSAAGMGTAEHETAAKKSRKDPEPTSAAVGV